MPIPSILESPSVLVVEDQHHALQWLRATLGKHGANQYHTAEDVRSFYDQLARGQYDVVSLDWELQNVERGPELLRHLREHHPDVARVVYTQHALRVDAAKAGGADFVLVKGPDDDDVYWETVLSAARLGLARRSARYLRAAGHSDIPDLASVSAISAEEERLIHGRALSVFLRENNHTLLRDYEKRLPLQSQFTDRVSDLVVRLLSESGISYQVVQQRTKTLKSLREKITRPGKSYSGGIDDITDLTGVRIIAYYLKDVNRICRLIRDEFDIDESNSGDKAEELGPTEFGYRSVHLAVSIGGERKGLLEWQRFEGLKAEVQVRTVLQHIWAAASHEMQYKREKDVLPLVRRRLARLSGVLELSDEEFTELKAEMDALHDLKK